MINFNTLFRTYNIRLFAASRSAVSNDIGVIDFVGPSSTAEIFRDRPSELREFVIVRPLCRRVAALRLVPFPTLPCLVMSPYFLLNRRPI